MANHIQTLIEEVYKRNLTLAQTEMQLVRSQINPHFVYNTLETIRAEAYLHEQYAIADMTTLLGKTLRYGISRQGDCVTVATELAHLQDYIAGSNSDYTSIGLRNTHCRLELFFGKPYGLSIRSVPGRGTSVTLRMPLMHKPFA